MSTLRNVTEPGRERSGSSVETLDKNQSMLSNTESLNSTVDEAQDSDSSVSSSDLSDLTRQYVQQRHSARFTPLSRYAANQIVTASMPDLLDILRSAAQTAALNEKLNNLKIIDKSAGIVNPSTPSINNEKRYENIKQDTDVSTPVKAKLEEKAKSASNTPIYERKERGEEKSSSGNDTARKESERCEEASKVGSGNDTLSYDSTGEVKVEWQALLLEMSDIGLELAAVLHREKELYQSIDDFIIRYGKLGERLAAEALPCIRDRREEWAFLTAFRKERRARRKREDEEVRCAWQELKFAMSHRRQVEEEERRVQLRLLRMYREEERVRNKFNLAEVGIIKNRAVHDSLHAKNFELSPKKELFQKFLNDQSL